MSELEKPEIVPITRDNLAIAAAAGARWGMPRSERWLRRILFDPTVEDMTDDTVRGHMAILKTGLVVAIQCYYYIPAYFHRQKILMNSGCILGADREYSTDMIICQEQNKATRTNAPVFVGNSVANKRSAAVSRLFYKRKDGPPNTWVLRFALSDFSASVIFILRRIRWIPKCVINIVWRLLRPLSWMCRTVQSVCRHKRGYRLVRYKAIDYVKFGAFWERFVECNDGLITSRTPERLSWLFNDSLAAGVVQLIAAERDGNIDGYVILRQKPKTFVPWQAYAEHLLCDICAVGNDEKCLERLVGGALTASSRDGGVRIEYCGALPGQDRWLNKFFKYCRKEDHPTYMYSASNDEIERSMMDGKGWFFGPLDGELCLGHGGYIDV